MRIRLRVVVIGAVAAVLLSTGAASAQTPPPRPVPFPTAGAPTPPAATPPTQAPTDEALGAPIYPAAVFLETIDAGKGGQQYHLYGTDTSYTDIVNYYRNVLRNGGRTIFQGPQMHQFDLGRFQEQTMAYPPSVVVKDYTWNGSPGYLHVEGTTMRRFATIIQVVPAK